MKQKKHRDPVAKSVHEGIAGLHRLGIVDITTLRRFDQSCLTPIEEFTPEDLKVLRNREGASQAVWASHFGVAISTVSQWERGERRPDGPAKKLLTLVKMKGLEYIR